jgi:hypothetical protein
LGGTGLAPPAALPAPPNRAEKTASTQTHAHDSTQTLARQKYWQIKRPQRESKIPTLCNHKT